MKNTQFYIFVLFKCYEDDIRHFTYFSSSCDALNSILCDHQSNYTQHLVRNGFKSICIIVVVFVSSVVCCFLYPVEANHLKKMEKNIRTIFLPFQFKCDILFTMYIKRKVVRKIPNFFSTPLIFCTFFSFSFYSILPFNHIFTHKDTFDQMKRDTLNKEQ